MEEKKKLKERNIIFFSLVWLSMENSREKKKEFIFFCLVNQKKKK